MKTWKILVIVSAMVVAYVVVFGDGPVTRTHKRRIFACVQMDAFATALEAYEKDVGSYPTTAQSFEALRTAPAGETKWRGPYLQREIPMDPWGHPYLYVAPRERGRLFEIASYGQDGLPGGDGLAEDVRYPCTAGDRD